MKTNFMSLFERTEHVSQNKLNLMTEKDLLDEYNKGFNFMLKCKDQADFVVLKDNIEMVHKEILRRFS
jgi:hypothetical protein